MRYFTILLPFLLSTICSAQEPKLEWLLQYDASQEFFGNLTPRGEFIDIEIDSQGDVFVITTFNEYVNEEITQSTDEFIFLIKYNSNGEMLWYKSLNFFSVFYKDLEIDYEDNIIITGSFRNTVDFDPNANNAEELTATSKVNEFSSNLENTFLLKLSHQGDFIWVKKLDAYKSNLFIKVDKNNNYFITGSFSGTKDFDPTENTTSLTALGGDGFDVSDIFILKLTKNGDFSWVKQIGSTNYKFLTEFEIDKEDNLLIGGTFSNSLDLDPSSNQSYVTQEATSYDSFIAKLDKDGGFVWGKNFANTVKDIETDELNNIYVCGQSYSQSMNYADFDPSSFNMTQVPYNNSYAIGFILKLDKDGTYSWVKVIRNDNDQNYPMVTNIKVDTQNDIIFNGYLGGKWRFQSMEHEYDSVYFQSSQNRNFVLGKISKNNEFQWVRSFSGDFPNTKSSLQTGTDNDIYSSFTFKNELNINQDSTLASNDLFDVAIYKYTQCNNFTPLVSIDEEEQNATLTTNIDNATYQWIDCSSNEPVENETNQSYSPLIPGSYGVEVSKYGCVGSSECFDFITTNVEKYSNLSFKIIPNPGNSYIHFESTEQIEQIDIYDISMKYIMTSANPKISIEHLTSGIYLAIVKTANGERLTGKFVKR